MLVQELLHLGGPDLEARAVDHVLDPVDDEDVPVLVHLAHVAGMEPSPANRRPGVVGPAPVAEHHARPLDRDLTQRSQGDLRITLVHDPQLEVLDRGPDAAEPVLEVVVVGGEG